MKNQKLNKFFAILMIIWILSSCSQTNELKEKNISNNTIEEKKQNFMTNYNKAKNKINNNSEIIKNDNISKKLTIDERCIGCGKCIRIAPNNFAMDFDIRKAVVISQENINSERVQASVQICPVDSIHIS